MPKPLRILQVITDTDRRGAQIFASDLGRALGQRGHTVHTVALRAGAQSPALPVETLGKRSRGPRTLRALRHRMSAADITVAHGSSTLLACAVAGIGPRRPFVYRQISDSKFWASSLTRRLRVALYLRFPRRIVALSQQARETLEGHLRVDPRRIDVVPNGVPTGLFEPPSLSDRSQARRDLTLAVDATVAAYVGALVPEKGVADVIAALRRLDEFVLLVVGSGQEQANLESLSQDLGDRVRFLGTVANTAPIFAASDLIVLPSRGGDSMPATLIEAGLCGLPTVSTPVGSIEDVVVDGQTGLIVPIGAIDQLASALRQLSLDPQLRRRLGTNARERCLALFEIDVVAQGWELALYAAATPRE